MEGLSRNLEVQQHGGNPKKWSITGRSWVTNRGNLSLCSALVRLLRTLCPLIIKRAS